MAFALGVDKKGISVDIKMYPWAVRRALEQKQPQTLKEAGHFVMRVSRGIIKQRRNPDLASAPGKPVHSHKRGANKGFKKTIVYALRPDRKAVWIGPQAVAGGLTKLAKTHEFGGRRMVIKADLDLLNGVNIGDLAPVTYVHLTAKDKVLSTDKNVDPKTNRKVVWIRIRTQDQAEHSGRLYRRMVEAYNSKVGVKYPARPYMRPSMMLSLPKLPFFWQGVIRT